MDFELNGVTDDGSCETAEWDKFLMCACLCHKDELDQQFSTF